MYGASPRSVGVMPMSRTMPTISNQGSGVRRIGTGVADAAANRAGAAHVPARERLVDDHGSSARRPIAVVEIAARDQWNVERVKEPRAHTCEPQVRDQHRCGPRRDLSLGGPDSRGHPRQTIREGHGANVGVQCDPPFEFGVDVWTLVAAAPDESAPAAPTSSRSGSRRMARYSSAGNCSRILRSRSASSEIPNAGGKKMTVSATCTIIAVVQNLPNRNVEPPTPSVPQLRVNVR